MRNDEESLQIKEEIKVQDPNSLQAMEIDAPQVLPTSHFSQRILRAREPMTYARSTREAGETRKGSYTPDNIWNTSKI